VIHSLLIYNIFLIRVIFPLEEDKFEDQKGHRKNMAPRDVRPLRRSELLYLAIMSSIYYYRN